jgi:hypothetical protein
MSDHLSILDKTIVLKLNRSWSPVDQMSVRDAVVFLNSQSDGDHPGYALDITTAVDENGDHVLVSAQPTAWENWVKLPVREGDLWIGVGRSADNPEGRIRAPLVVICAHFDKIPMRTTRWSTGNVHRRDNFICAYTKRKLTRAELSVDHIDPRSRGGRDTWENTVTCDKRINTMKADKTPEEAGLPRPRPKAPASVPPIVHLREDPKHPVWKPFLG